MKSSDALTIVVALAAGYVIYEILESTGILGSSFPSNWLTAGDAPQYVPTINAVENQYGLPTNYLAAVAYQESGFNPAAVNSSSGALGMFQLLPTYYPNAGQSWQTDADTAAQSLSSYASQFGDWQLALAAYNWGPTALSSSSMGFCALPSETQNYVSAISAAVPVSGSLVSV